MSTHCLKEPTQSILTKNGDGFLFFEVPLICFMKRTLFGILPIAVVGFRLLSLCRFDQKKGI